MTTKAAVALADLVLRVGRSEMPVVLGLVGPPGVGKSYAADALARQLRALGVPTAVVPMDGFHLSNAQLDRLDLRSRKGSPETFDLAGLIALLERVRAADGMPVFAPDYDRDLHEPIAARRCVEPDTRAVVVEGNYLLHDAAGWGRVRTLLDVAWYLEAPEDVRVTRLVERHVRSGRSPSDAREWVQRVDLVNARTIAAGRDRADFVVDASTVGRGSDAAARGG